METDYTEKQSCENQNNKIKVKIKKSSHIYLE